MGGRDLTGLLMSTTKETLTGNSGLCSYRATNMLWSRWGKTTLCLDSLSIGNDTGAPEFLL